MLLTLCIGMLTASGEETLVLPAGVKVIETEAFLNVTGIQYVVVPDGTQEIGPRAFAGSSVTYIVIPASVTTIATTPSWG